jgi:hypothetical protein
MLIIHFQLQKANEKIGKQLTIAGDLGSLVAIDDDILHKHTLTLSNYDFETDVDVNILGHIFEHSLGEIENVQAEIKGEKVDSQKTRRKKDGIFYTPKYIRVRYLLILSHRSL